MTTCPACGKESDNDAECAHCGIFFAKWEALYGEGAVPPPAPRREGISLYWGLLAAVLVAVFWSSREEEKESEQPPPPLIQQTAPRNVPPSLQGPQYREVVQVVSVPMAVPPPSSAPLPPLFQPNFGDVPLQYYDVHGKTPEELNRGLRSSGLRAPDGTPAMAVTISHISYDWPRGQLGACSLNQATVNADIKVVFPRWTPPPDVSPELVSSWNNVMYAIAQHERRHVDIVTMNLHTLKNVIESATCETADQEARAFVAYIQQLQVDYDRAYGHMGPGL